MNKLKLYEKSLLKVFKNNKYIFSLICICCLSFFLNFYDIYKYGYGNEYYAAAVKSMSQNFKNFFFISFDPSGMISVDKPPLGLWIQTIFVLLFGYSGYSLILPQALCGTGCCILIYLITSNTHNEICGLISSFIFAIIPSVVVVSRNNTMDMQLIFITLLAVFYFFKYIKLNKSLYLFISATFIGLAFNIKMLQAYIILPSLFIIYIIFNKKKFTSKLSQGIIASLIIFIISFSWITFVDLYPSSSRPYIDNSKNNSALELIISYNGIDRLIGLEKNNYISSFINENNTSENSGDYIGKPSLFRLWGSSLYGQISWMLILAISSLILHPLKINIKDKNLENANFVFWALWLITTFLIFSFSGFFHRYYLSMLAPPIAVLSAITITDWIKILKIHKAPNSFYGIISILSIVATIGSEFIYVYKYQEIRLTIISVSFIMLLASIIIFIYNIKAKENFNIYISTIFLIGSFTIAPLYWSLTTLVYVPNLTMPSAGPELADEVTNASSISTNKSKNTSSGLQNYLISNYKQGSFLVVAKKSVDVSKLIINTGLPAYAYGGFLGTTETLTLDKLEKYIKQNKITYFLISHEDMNDTSPSDIVSYVKKNGKLINPIDYGDVKSLNSMPVSSDSSLNNISNIGGGYGASLYLLGTN